MGKLLKKIGQCMAKHKWAAIIIWLVALLGFGTIVAKLGSNYNESLSISGIPSTEIQSTLKKEFHQDTDHGTLQVVIKTKDKKGLLQPKTEQAINSAVTKAKKKPHVASVTNPYQEQKFSKDLTTTYATVTYDQKTNSVTPATIHKTQQAFKTLDDQKGVEVEYTGTVSIHPMRVNEIAELIGVAIAFVFMMVLFRSFITAGLPIISAVTGLALGLIVIGIGSNYFETASVAQSLAMILSLACGIDYALFIINRYRTNRATQNDYLTALGDAMGTAGSSVLFAGITVIIAVSGLSLVGIDFLTQMGLAAAVGVAFAILSAMTLLPALISLAHRHIKPAKEEPHHRKNKSGIVEHTIIKHPFVTAIASVLVLIAFAIPSGHMRLGMPYNGALPTNQTERKAYDILSDKFGEGINGQLIVVAKLDKNASPQEKQQTVMKITDHLSNMKYVKMATPGMISGGGKVGSGQSGMQQGQQPQPGQMNNSQQPGSTTNAAQQSAKQKQMAGQGQPGQQASAAQQQMVLQQSGGKLPDGNYAVFMVIPTHGPESVKTDKLAHNIKKYSKTTEDEMNTKLILTGSNAINIDIVQKLNHAIPIFAGIVMALAFVLMMLVFRSFIVPLVAMAGFGMSLLASFGALTAVMQDAVMHTVFGISKGAPIIAFLPVIAIGILFGLAMYYEVFLVSRIREIYLLTGDTTEAVRIGMRENAKVIITAGLIMISVFGSFAVTTNPTSKSIGLALAFGVFFDAFIVRLIFVPAMIKLCGKWNWIFPGMRTSKIEQQKREK